MEPITLVATAKFGLEALVKCELEDVRAMNRSLQTRWVGLKNEEADFVLLLAEIGITCLDNGLGAIGHF
jgi:hypothetical protein